MNLTTHNFLLQEDEALANIVKFQKFDKIKDIPKLLSAQGFPTRSYNSVYHKCKNYLIVDTSGIKDDEKIIL